MDFNAGVATAFAARDILGNVLSGLSMQFSKPFSLGDTIRVCHTPLCYLYLGKVFWKKSFDMILISVNATKFRCPPLYYHNGEREILYFPWNPLHIWQSLDFKSLNIK